MSHGPATIVQSRLDWRGQGAARVISRSRPPMINALSWEPAIGHKPGDPPAASPATAIKMKNSAKPAPAPSAEATSLQVTARRLPGWMRRDTHQGDRQQRAAHSYKLQTRGTLSREKADGNRNCGRGDAGDRRHDLSWRRPKEHDRTAPTRRHPPPRPGRPTQGQSERSARMSPPDRSRAAACSPASIATPPAALLHAGPPCRPRSRRHPRRVPTRRRRRRSAPRHPNPTGGLDLRAGTSSPTTASAAAREPGSPMKATRQPVETCDTLVRAVSSGVVATGCLTLATAQCPRGVRLVCHRAGGLAIRLHRDGDQHRESGPRCDGDH